MRIFKLFFLGTLFCSLLSAQEIHVVDFEIVNNDTIFFTDLPEVEILEFKNKEERNAYFLLKRRVFKVYPYALLAKSKLDEIRIALDTIPKRRKKKRYAKEVANWVKDEYADTLKKLTMTEGKILVKLIYRETNTTSYEIVKSYRGRFNAFFWQTLAKIWDNNLKTSYYPDVNREDMLIEYIIIQAKLEGKLE